jgi:chromate transporter
VELEAAEGYRPAMSPSLPALAWSFFRIGCGAFGGGVASFPVFVAELSRRRGWLSESDLAGDFALSQSVPGVIIVNFACLSARRLRGVPGALAAAFSVVLPAFLLVLALAAALARWGMDAAWLSAAVAGLRPAVIALLLSAAVSLFRRAPRTPLAAVLALLAAAATLCRAPVLLVLALAAAAGLFAPARKGGAQ